METKLHSAVRFGNEEHVLQALKEGCDPNQIGDYKWSPVHEASQNGERDILKLLVLFNADVNQVDELHGNTPLHYAAQEDNSACVTVLLTAGASVNAKNDDGLTPQDVATSSCKERMDMFLNSQNSTATGDWKEDLGGGPGGGRPAPRGKTDANQNEAWEGLGDVPDNAAIGNLHLSFEYHKSNLKVRVWQVSDLLLPPPQTSMIESIFVRGYFIPDLPRKTHRKTEDVRVDTSSRDISKSVDPSDKSGIQHIFTPSSFRFETPLVYMGLTQEIVSERSIQMEVCMTQKHTHKAFLIAMVHMPLRTAVRRPIRQEYGLIPCMNYTIPNNMRIYSAKDVFVDGSLQRPSSYSRSNSLHSNGDLHERDSTPLGSVQSDIPARRFISVDISISDSDDNDKEDNDDDVDDGIGSSVDVKISSGKESASSSVAVDMIEYGLDENESTGQLMQVVSHKAPDAKQNTSVVDMNYAPSESRPKKKIIPNEVSIQSEDEASDSEPVASSVVEIEEEPKSTLVDMEKLQKDVVLDLESLDKEQANQKHSNASQGPEDKTAALPKKKKIIPFEAEKTQSEVETGRLHFTGKKDNEMEVNSNLNSLTVPELTVKNLSSREQGNKTLKQSHDDEEIDDDVAQEIESARLQGSSSEMSKDEAGSTPTPNSRPETPIWDYYDFDDSTAAESDPNSKPEGEKTTSTLQESLARLSRPQTILETCRVAGPVLPSVVLDDFEMDDD